MKFLNAQFLGGASLCHGQKNIVLGCTIHQYLNFVARRPGVTLNVKTSHVYN